MRQSTRQAGGLRARRAGCGCRRATRGVSSTRSATASWCSTSVAAAAAARTRASVDNTTWHLVADMEQLRKHLGIERWLVFGGSWGSTLALAYAETHPKRGHRAGAARDLHAAQVGDATGSTRTARARSFPTAGSSTSRRSRARERGDLVSAYYRRLTEPQPRDAARRPRRPGRSGRRATSFLRIDEAQHRELGQPTSSRSRSRASSATTSSTSGFFEREDQLLRNVRRIRHIPAVIVQGRYDVVCPMRSAWDLHRAWPEADFRVVADAGHSALEPGNTHELVSATDRFAR